MARSGGTDNGDGPARRRSSGAKTFVPPVLPAGVKLPSFLKLKDGRPTPRWGDIADVQVPSEGSDRISSLLKRVRIGTILTGIIEGGDEWGLELPPLPCAYLAVLSGRLWLRLEGEAAIEMSAGDCVLFSQPVRPRVSSGPETRTRSIFEVVPHGPHHAPMGFKMGEGPVRARFTGGPLMFDSGVGGPLRSALPRSIVLRGSSQGPEAMVPTLVRLLERQNLDREPGAQAMTNQLATMLFIAAVRQYLATPEALSSRWAGALFDEHIGPMLGLLHATPAREWSLEDMANESGLSRTVFVQKFQELVGTPPAAYVREHRMQVAKDLLRTSEVDVRSIASRVGYSSEAAFCKVFKKVVGVSPGEFRAAERPMHLGGPGLPPFPGGSAAVGSSEE